ncbi:MAG: alginate export family protein [Deltaproteobacteria bacterium]|nr:alginate export family protein [Deltaproteobacteria bacterium]
MIRRLGAVLMVLMLLAVALPSLAADVKIKGDFNNRFMVYTNHNDWLDVEEGVLRDGSSSETWGEAKYRMWFDAGTDDGKVKGVWAMEIGGLEYGKPSVGGSSSTGGSYSGDNVNIETRWLYTDFQLPWACEKARVRMGLQPFNANSFFWSETIMGVTSDIAAGPVNLNFAWLRPYRDETKDPDDDVEDLDAFYVRADFKPADGIKAGVFGVYMTGDPDNSGPATSTITSQKYEVKNFANKYELDLFTLGLDGKADIGKFFVNWDLMYQNGSVDGANFAESYNSWAYNKAAVDQNFDVSAWFAHFDLGFKMDKMKFTYTFWYSSGDDDGADGDFDAFMAVDIDRMDNICIFEGGFTDDDYYTEKGYLLDKGFIMNKLAFDYKASKKLALGAAAMYMLTAEDIEYVDKNGKLQKEDEVGIEFDAYLKYKLYDNLEFAINAGYLFSGDAMDFWEVQDRDGSSDEDIFISTMRVRYSF